MFLVTVAKTHPWTLVASSYRGQNQSTACFDCWPKCAHRGIVDWFLLSFWPPSTMPDIAFNQLKTVDSFWPVIVLTTRKVWQCLTFKSTRYLGKYINILNDFDSCNHTRVKQGTGYYSYFHECLDILLVMLYNHSMMTSMVRWNKHIEYVCLELPIKSRISNSLLSYFNYCTIEVVKLILAIPRHRPKHAGRSQKNYKISWWCCPPSRQHID